MYNKIKIIAKPFWIKILSIRTIIDDLAMEVKKIFYRLQRKSIIKNYLATQTINKLQIGGGSNPFPGWLNTDITPNADNTIFLDATEQFPFEEDSFDYVFCEHMIEHISYLEGINMLQECYRILKQGGKIRVSTPNLKIFLELFHAEKSETQLQYLEWISTNWLQKQGIKEKGAAFPLNLVMHSWGQQFIYDESTLKKSLKKCGFVDITTYQTNQSYHNELKNLESHGNYIGNTEMNDFETLVVEACKSYDKQ